MRLRMSAKRSHRDGELGHLDDDVPAMADKLSHAILTSFSLSVVSDHCSTASDNARVRMKGREVICECMRAGAAQPLLRNERALFLRR